MRVFATGLSIVLLSVVAALVWWRSANIGPVQRGADLVRAQGCAGCHEGSGASPLLPRTFADLDDVTAATLREWILDGMHLRKCRRSKSVPSSIVVIVVSYGRRKSAPQTSSPPRCPASAMTIADNRG